MGAAERQQQQLMMQREHREDREVEHAVREKRDSFSQKKYASISQLKSLEHALLRSNPELEVLRPRHGDRDLSDSTEGDARGQNLVGILTATMTGISQGGDTPDTLIMQGGSSWHRWGGTLACIGVHRMKSMTSRFLHPTRRVSSRAKPLCLQAVSCSHQATRVTRAGAMVNGGTLRPTSSGKI